MQNLLQVHYLRWEEFRDRESDYVHGPVDVESAQIGGCVCAWWLRGPGSPGHGRLRNR
jgi:hypothetical protein